MFSKQVHNSISNYEKQYMDILREAYTDGFKSMDTRSGQTVYRLPMVSIRVDVGNEFPIIRSKKLNYALAFEEVMWIWSKLSTDARDLSIGIWDDQIIDKDTHSIGKNYAYQLKKPVHTFIETPYGKELVTYSNQVEYIIQTLKRDPSDRRCSTTIWCPTELDGSAMPPCVHTATWTITNGKLNLLLHQRSGDLSLGVPFNTTQYAMLMHAIARDIGCGVGILLHTMADVNLYECQMRAVKSWLDNYDRILSCKSPLKQNGLLSGISARDILNCSPQLVISKNASYDFFRMDSSDFTLKDYKCGSFISIPKA